MLGRRVCEAGTGKKVMAVCVDQSLQTLDDLIVGEYERGQV